MSLINTTHGALEETTLARTVGFVDKPFEFVVWVEWRISGHTGESCPVCQDASNPRPDALGTMVRRDAHVILKQPSAIADALVGGIG